MRKLLILLIITIVFNSCKQNKFEKKSNRLSLGDQIAEEYVDDREKKAILDSAFSDALNKTDDSLRTSILLEISYQYLKLGDSSTFLISNREARKSSIKIMDSSALASTYWDLAHYYHKKNKEDKAYFNYNKAQKIYQSSDDEFNSARLLLNMAIIQRDIKDYTGSEVSTSNAITLFKPLRKYKYLYSSYNNLGIIYNELEQYEKSLEYYKIAVKYLSKTEEKDLYPSVFNNIGMVYQRSGKYTIALQYFDKALNFDKELSELNPRLYAMILDNTEYTKLQIKDTVGIYSKLIKALNIRTKIKDESGIAINQLHLAEYFLEIKDTVNSFYYAKRANTIASENQNISDQLYSFKFLSSISKADSAKYYLQRYISINDSLQKQERAVRDKYTRIRFETDEYISKAELLNNRIYKITLISIVALLTLLVFYLISDQRSKSKIFKQKQYANQEIYKLVLEQQSKFEEGREKEKLHISRELHDGILGKLFGIRLNLDSLNEEDDSASKMERFQYIKEIQNISEEIRDLSHKLNKNPKITIDFNSVIEELIFENNSKSLFLNLELDSTINWNKIEDEIKINIYRILQESIVNIIKHSKANKANLRIVKANKKLELIINDNGIGFSGKKVSRGIGLKNINNRIENLKGQIILKGNNGMEIHIIIPYKNKQI
ncbi:MAG: tetratricopeptide repeat protein [Maribacter arcticus]|uniref:tetratricopeptide repeat-containing sensor histidine kinase n=1 Tax=Maribacter arcticus TaxID=561365 RepID=UPI0030011657